MWLSQTLNTLAVDRLITCWSFSFMTISTMVKRWPTILPVGRDRMLGCQTRIVLSTPPEQQAKVKTVNCEEAKRTFFDLGNVFYVMHEKHGLAANKRKQTLLWERLKPIPRSCCNFDYFVNNRFLYYFESSRFSDYFVNNQFSYYFVNSRLLDYFVNKWFADFCEQSIFSFLWTIDLQLS